MRSAMVDSQLRTSDVNDPRILAAVRAVPREEFVPAGRRDVAYVDRAIPLSGGRALNPPLATARLLAEADVAPGDKVLLIGAATGYCAAILAELGATVVAVEVDEALKPAAAPARVEWISGPLAAGAPAHAPYDVLLIDGAVHQLPDALLAQLADGGRISTGLIERGVARLCAGRVNGGAMGLTRLADMEMVTLPGFEPAKGFAF